MARYRSREDRDAIPESEPLAECRRRILRAFRAVARRAERAIVVTQRFHLARSVYTARHLGLEAWGCAADRRRYPRARRNALREMLARVKAFIDLHLRTTRPRYLGPEIPISGNGRVTWDQLH